MTRSSPTDLTEPRPDIEPTAQRIGVVVPAHNEAPIIGRFLRDLIAGAPDNALDILVVANGCTDDTADQARSVAGVRVIETEIGDKPTALDLADAEGTIFPRFYVDADVVLTAGDLLRAAAALDGTVHAVAPRLEVNTSGSDRFVRSYYEIWTRLPWATDDLIGSGIYGLSEAGRARFADFHPDGADDLWVSAHFAPNERRSVDGTSFEVAASKTAPQAIKRKSRIHAANELIKADLAGLPGANEPGGSALGPMLRAEPRLAPHMVVYVVMSMAARLLARRKIASGEVAWDGDARS